MKRGTLMLAATLPLVAASLWVGRATAVDDDEEAIRAAVQHYFDGMMKASPSDLEVAFHAEARLIGVNSEGGAWIIPFDEWASSWAGRDPRDPARYVNRIVSVDIAGNAASVKTDLEWPNVHYIDYLSLLKVDDAWKIVNKIWTEERR